MTALDLTHISPAKALQLYRSGLEDTDQALPILAIQDSDGHVQIHGLVDVDPASHARQLRRELSAPLAAAMLSAEAWVRRYEGGHEVGLDEAVTIIHVSSAGSWAASQSFARTGHGEDQKVTFRGELVVVAGVHGGLVEDLRALVTAPDHSEPT